MYKTNAEVQKISKELIVVEMDESKEKVEIYIRNAEGSRIVNEALISLSPEGFLDVVYPILQAKGYVLVAPLEGF